MMGCVTPKNNKAASEIKYSTMHYISNSYNRTISSILLCKLTVVCIFSYALITSINPCKHQLNLHLICESELIKNIYFAEQNKVTTYKLHLD